MKKAIVLILSLITVLTLAACKPEVSAEIVSYKVSAETITLDLKVYDDNNKIVKNSFIAKTSEEGTLKSEVSTYTTVDEEAYVIQFKVGSLERGVTYDVKIYATIDGNQVELAGGTYKTIEGGTSDNPISINNTEEFLDIADSPNSYFVMESDIDFEGQTIKAEDFFGTSSSSSAFKGYLDGKGFTVKNLNLKTTSKPSYIGLFGYVYGSADNEDANIKDLTLDNINILAVTYNATFHAGILAGRVANNSVIKNVTIKNSSMTFELKGNSVTPSNIGGAIGHLEGEVSNLVTENVNINASLGGTNSVNIGGAIGYVYHSSSPKAIDKVSASGSINFTGAISSSQTRAVIANIGGVFGHYSIHKGTSEIASAVNINVKDFQFTAREGIKDSNDSLRVGGLIAELSTGNLVNKGYSAGSISVNAVDEYKRVEEVIVSGLVARTRKENSTALLSRLSSNIPITVKSNAKILNVSDYAGFDFGIDTNDTIGDLYGTSSVLVNGTDKGNTATATGNGIDSLESDFIKERYASNYTGFFNVVTTGKEIALDVNYVYQNGVYNRLDYSLKISKGGSDLETKQISSDFADTVIFSGLDADTDYTVTAYNGTTELYKQTIRTGNNSINVSDVSVKINKYSFNFTTNGDGIDEESLATSIYLNGSLVKKTSTGSKEVEFTGLRANTTYDIVTTATVNSLEEAVIYKTKVTTNKFVEGTISNIVLKPTSISFDLIVEEGNEEVNYSTLKVKIYQNGGTAIDTKDLDSNSGTPKNITFEELTLNTYYSVYVTATVNGSSDTVIGIYQSLSTETITATVDNFTVTRSADPNHPDTVVDVTFDVSVIGNDNNDVTDIKVQIWYRGSRYSEEAFGSGSFSHTNLKEGAVIVIKVIGTADGETVELYSGVHTLNYR